MNNPILAAAKRLIVVVSLVAGVACIESPTGPTTPKGPRAAKDTAYEVSDSTLCRSGWSVVMGRIYCNADQ